MREIKFRAWDKRRKRMYTVLSLHTATLMNGGIWATVNGRDVIEDKDIHIPVQPKDVELMQYTGLKDKNGKEIYEEDLWLPTGCETVRIVREYKNGYWFHHPSTGNPTRLIEWAEDGEIVGNIYSNPELLEVNP